MFKYLDYRHSVSRFRFKSNWQMFVSILLTPSCTPSVIIYKQIMLSCLIVTFGNCSSPLWFLNELLLTLLHCGFTRHSWLQFPLMVPQQVVSDLVSNSVVIHNFKWLCKVSKHSITCQALRKEISHVSPILIDKFQRWQLLRSNYNSQPYTLVMHCI